MKTYPIDDIWKIVYELQDRTLKIDKEDVKELKVIK